jgi:hypothetical protein
MREAQKREQQLDAKLREQEAKMSALIAEKQREIDSAKDEAQRIRLREEKQALQEKQSQLATPRRRGSDTKEERPVTSTPAFTGQKKKISDDPLDGL